MLEHEKRLIDDVLNVAHLTALPKKGDAKKIWIEAIAKIKLADGSVGYGMVGRNHDLSYRVTYVNGNISAIAEIEEIYPYVFLQPEFVQKFGRGEKEGTRIAYLKSQGLPWAQKEGYFDNMSVDDLNKEVIKAAVYNQLKSQRK